MLNEHGSLRPGLLILDELAQLSLGLGTAFRSEKIPRQSEFRGRANSEARNVSEFCEKN